jgi:hypothetical protein
MPPVTNEEFKCYSQLTDEELQDPERISNEQLYRIYGKYQNDAKSYGFEQSMTKEEEEERASFMAEKQRFYNESKRRAAKGTSFGGGWRKSKRKSKRKSRKSKRKSRRR